jgi:pimeloyl-ACP methyl ester carboxylesterase
MNNLKKNHTINDWEPLPYDWRLSYNDILNNGSKEGDNIYYGKASSAPFILQEIKHLAETSKTGKVTIVAHSNGGLLTKALMQKLEAQGLTGLVDKIIFVAVPQIGTPAAIAAILHGEDQGLPFAGFNIFLSNSTARTLAGNAPGAYALLPSANYFTYVDTPPITFSNPLVTGWRAFYGDLIHSKERLHQFLVDVMGRSAPLESDTSRPSILRENLLTAAENIHQNLDTWKAPPGVKIIEIAGWGIPSTISSIDYSNGTVDSTLPVKMTPTFVSDGDGTVVSPSALWMGGPSIERYWLNLAKYNSDHKFSNPMGRSHKDIFEVTQVRDFITKIIQNQNSTSLSPLITTTEPISESNIKHLQFALHSPLSLDLYDNLGRHTGISTTTGRIEEGIPGTYYQEFNEIKYIFSEEGSENHIAMSGYAPGTFTFNIDESVGGIVTASTTFANIPTTPQTKVSFSVQNTLATASNLAVDTDGNGTIDISLAPKLGKIVTIDKSPPTTTIKLSGVKGKNNWYTSDVSFTLNATDTESAIASTTYSINNGISWISFASTSFPVISKEGTTTILYYSIDAFGNRESVASTTLKIDKTAPEITLSYEPQRQKLKITGSDNLSSNLLINTSATSSVATDAAGHTIQILYSQPKAKDRRIRADITKILYDGVPTTSTAIIKYKWNIKKDSSFSLFAEYAQTKNLEAEAHFRPKKNQTILMLKPIDIDDGEDDNESDNRTTRDRLSGMVVVGLVTEKGVIKINY